MAKNENAAAAEAAAPKTTQELLTLAEARVAKLRQRLTTENVLNGIEAGQTVGFRFGRNIPERTNKAGETVPARAARQLSGTVMGVQDILDDNGVLTGKVIKVQAGEGFDADIYKVNARDITSVGDTATDQDDEEQEAADIAEAEAAAAGEDPVEARDDALDGVDPLEAAE
jgi:hypothetical protein